MNDAFGAKVRAAAAAGWWTLLIAGVFLVLQWIAYLVVMAARPAWFLSMWGPGTEWAFAQKAWFWTVLVLKFTLWLLALIVIWLTLWARQLRRQTGGA